MIIGVTKETYPGERRVSIIPDHIPSLTKAGLKVIVESGAGLEAGFSDPLYRNKDAEILPRSWHGMRPPCPRLSRYHGRRRQSGHEWPTRQTLLQSAPDSYSILVVYNSGLRGKVLVVIGSVNGGAFAL